MKKKERKPDDPVIVYRQLTRHISHLSDLVDKISNIQGCYLDQIFNTISPIIQQMIPKIKDIAMIGMKPGQLNVEYTVHGKNTIDIQLPKKKSSSNEIEKLFDRVSSEGCYFWNFRPDTPNFFKASSDQRAFIITYLSRLPNNEQLFLIMATQPVSSKKRKHNDFFITYEINTLKLMSKIIGKHISNVFNFEVNQYLMAKEFERH